MNLPHYESTNTKQMVVSALIHLAGRPANLIDPKEKNHGKEILEWFYTY